ncbi:MAG: type II toxin-antitoxin system Phd/YefM family antitoxin [Brevundimonas sp.]
MVETVGVFDGKARFSELIDRAERGEEIVVTRHGKPVAKVVPLGPSRDVPKRSRRKWQSGDAGARSNLRTMVRPQWKRFWPGGMKAAGDRDRRRQFGGGELDPAG